MSFIFSNKKNLFIPIASHRIDNKFLLYNHVSLIFVLKCISKFIDSYKKN